MPKPNDTLTTIDLASLETVSGGRYTKGPEQIDPALLQGIAELAKAVSSVGQNLAGAKAQSDGQMMQMMQMMMQAKSGRG